MSDLADRVLAGDHRALARAITRIENRAPGYRDLVSALYPHAGDAQVVGVTGPPGAGKSTLVDKLATAHRERGDTVGVIAVDPASPFTGGAVLGDRVRMAENAGDMDVFFRSMSARGAMGGLSAATTDAVVALSAFGKDVVIVETVGAGQNEIDVVRTADTVAVLVPPGAGDDVQTLKAGILEIADVFVVNKADLDGADRMVHDLRAMIEEGGDADWNPPVLETVATDGDGVEEVLGALGTHREFLERTGRLEDARRGRYAAAIRTLLREDAAGLLEEEIEARGGMAALVDRVLARETDPYAIADDLLDPVAACLGEARETTNG